MSDISGYIKQIETATRGEQVRDAIIDALKAINNGGNVLSLNGISANKFVTRDEWDLVFPLLDSVVDNSDKGVKSDGIYSKLIEIAGDIDEYVNRETTSSSSIAGKLSEAVSSIKEIAMAIKRKTGDFDINNAALSSFASAIDGIEGTTDMNITDIHITKNGTYPDTNQGGNTNDVYSSVTVEVQPEIIKNKSITKVDSEGKFTLRIADETGENKEKDGYDEVSIDVSGQLKDLTLDPNKISSNPAKEVTHVFASNETGETGASADIIGYKKVTLDIQEKFAPLTIEIDPSQTEEITFDATKGAGYDGGGSLYGYNIVKVKCVEASGPFIVRFWNENELLKTVENVQKHSTVTYDGPNPTRDGQTFTGWNPRPYDVISNMDCYAEFKEGTAAVSPSGQVGDSWNDIVNSGGADIPIGATKTLFVEEHECSLTSLDLDVAVTVPRQGIDMVKVASNMYGHTSVWMSKTSLSYKVRLYEKPYDFAVSGPTYDPVGFPDSDLQKYLDGEFLKAASGVDRDKFGDAADLAQGIKPTNIYCGVGSAFGEGTLKSAKNTTSYIWPPSNDEYTQFVRNVSDSDYTVSFTAGNGNGIGFRDCSIVSASIVDEEIHYKTENGERVEDYRTYTAGASLGTVGVLNNAACDELGFKKDKMCVAGGAQGTGVTWYRWFAGSEDKSRYASQYMKDLSSYMTGMFICFCT